MGTGWTVVTDLHGPYMCGGFVRVGLHDNTTSEVSPSWCAPLFLPHLSPPLIIPTKDSGWGFKMAFLELGGRPPRMSRVEHPLLLVKRLCVSEVAPTKEE